jgi:hypothetical protein
MQLPIADAGRYNYLSYPGTFCSYSLESMKANI